MGGGNDAVSKERGGQVRQAKAVSLGWFVLRPRRFVWVWYGRESILEFQAAMRQQRILRVQDYNNCLNCQNGQVTLFFLSSLMRRKSPPVTILPLDEIIHHPFQWGCHLTLAALGVTLRRISVGAWCLSERELNLSRIQLEHHTSTTSRTYHTHLGYGTSTFYNTTASTCQDPVSLPKMSHSQALSDDQVRLPPSPNNAAQHTSNPDLGGSRAEEDDRLHQARSRREGPRDRDEGRPRVRHGESQARP